MRFFYLLFLLTLLHQTALADKTKFVTLNREDGLSHSTVNAIVQDHSGYMWLGTQDGLVRYDGYEFKVFRPKQGNSQSIQDSWISSLFVDANNRLWARFDGGGISVYDPDNCYFINLVADPADSTSLSSDLGPTNSVLDNKYTTCETPDGNVWIATRYGLNRVDKDFKCRQYLKGRAKNGGLTSNYISSLFYDKTLNQLLVGTDKGLNIIDLTTNEVRHYEHELMGAHIRIINKDPFNTYWVGTKNSGLFKFQLSPSGEMIESKRLLSGDHIPLSERQISIHEILVSSTNEIWVAMDNGLYQFDYRGQLIKNHLEGYGIPAATHILEDGSGQIWVSSVSPNSGLIAIDPKLGQLTEYHPKDAKEHGYMANYIQTMYFDEEGILWIGTIKRGVIKYNTHLAPFEAFNEQYFMYNDKVDAEVYGIHKYQDEIFVGTRSRLYRFDEDFGLNDIYEFGEESQNIVSNIIGVIKPQNERLWVGYFRGKVSALDLKTNQYTHFAKHDPRDSTQFNAWSLRDIAITKNETVYFATISGGLIYQKKGSNAFYNLEDDFKDIDLHFGGIMTVKEDHLGQILIGTTNKGLYIYRPNNHSIRQLTKEDNGLSHNEIRSIHQDFMGNIWLGTRFGLTELNSNYEVMHTYFYKDGLPSNIIHGILEDDYGNLWMSTNDGISRFDLKSRRFINFSEKDGLTANEFNECAYFKDDKGVMYFGGFKGITRFDPREIKADFGQPEVHFTDLEVNQKVISPKLKIHDYEILNQNIDHTVAIELPYQLNNIKLMVSTLDYQFPDKVQYRYKLEQLDDEWNVIRDGAHQIEYSSLVPGEYQLKVQASNAEGVWSSHQRMLAIHILPPWYQTMLFKASLSISLLLISLAAIFLYIRQINVRKKLLTQTVEQKTRALQALNEELLSQQNVMLEQNSRLQNQSNELELQKKNLELLGKMGKAITADVEFTLIFQNIFSSISNLMELDELMLGEWNKKTQKIDLWGIKSGVEDFSRDEIDIESNDRLSCWVVKNNQNLFSNDLAASAKSLLSKPASKYFKADGPKSGIYVPIIGSKGNVRGVLVAISQKSEAYTETHLSILENIASYVSIAMSNARAYQKIQVQSEQLVQIDQMKSDFFTNVSHEFRTPLSLILGPLEGLMNSRNLSRNEQHTLGLIERNARMLLELVEQIMELSRIDGGVMKLNQQTTNIGEHFENIRESFSHLALQKNIHLLGKNGLQGLESDYDVNVFNKILYNLLNNAIKYTPQGGEITFSGQCKDSGIEFVISDNGAGISPEEVEKIFDRFHRLASHGNISGFGIGLSLVKQLVDLVKGTISVESKKIEDFPEDHGTTFSIFIPLKLQKAKNLHAKEKGDMAYDSLIQPAKSDKADLMLKTKVLVVEDNPDLRYFLVSQLQEEYHTIYAENGLQALELVKKEQPQIILSDIMMPKMGGIELCKRLREDTSTSHIPIILITAKDAPKDKTAGLKAGASDYLVKPFPVEELFLKVGNILTKRLQLIEQFKNNVWTGIQELGDGLSANDQEFLSEIKNIIEDEIDNPNLDIDHFCHQLGVSRTWLYNKMKSLLDMSMNEFIRSCRMKHGAKLLIFEKMTVAQSAYAVGFNDPKYFTRCFKKEFGMSPKAYIEQSVNA
ncbi:two-component regulator propeller domain-containing protein [Persicobacter diffluens]|uniref:histidine kinase n=1 Tax=Persicobacter diffluens TaxID=981 RepID=A0AAN5AQ09_9BACT|nr:hypothetical protein PEDI_49450 [Persicobacter diffluens]